MSAPLRAVPGFSHTSSALAAFALPDKPESCPALFDAK